MRSKFPKLLLNLRKDRLLILLLLLFVVRLASIVVALDKKDAYLQAIYFLEVTFLYIALKVFFKGQAKKIKKFLEYYFVSCTVAAVFGIIQALYFVFKGISYWDLWSWQYPSGFRLSGMMLDSNHYAAFLLTGLLLGIPVSYNLWKERKWWGIPSFYLIFISFFLASSRSNLLSFAASLVIFFTLLFLRKYFKVTGYTFLLTLSAFILGFVINKGIEVYAEKYVQENFVIHSEVTPLEDIPKTALFLSGHKDTSTLKEGTSFVNSQETSPANTLAGLLPTRVKRVFDASAKAHLAFIKASFYLFLDQPLLGVGYGNFAEGLKSSPYLPIIAEHDPRGANQEDFPSHTHWGGVLAETGIFGFLFYTLIIIVIIKGLFKNKSPLGVGILTGFIGLQIFSIFYHLNEEFYWIYAFLGLNYSRYKKL